jgi:hypothetical protein
VATQVEFKFHSRGEGCCRCGKKQHADGSAVTWKCQGCQGLVCRECTLTIPGSVPLEYYEETLCSVACWQAIGSPDPF